MCTATHVKYLALLTAIRHQNLVWDNWYTLCCTTITCDPLLSQASTMLRVKYRYSEPVADPAPCTSSAEDIEKAQAIREALRRQLLGRAEPQFIPCWIVGAD